MSQQAEAGTFGPTLAPRALADRVQRKGRLAFTLRAVRRGIFVLFGIVVFGIAGFVAYSSVMRVQGRDLPDVTGPFAVGRTEFTLRDTGRIDPFASDSRSRELAVWVWYPAVDGDVGAKAAYLPAAWAPLVENLGPLSQDLSAVRTNAMANAALEGHPRVVVLLPGLGQPIASYSALAEDLASHGYAVVGINPTESANVVFPDGHIVSATALGSVDGASVDDWYLSAERVTKVWVADAQFVVRTLAANAPAIGALDFAHVAYIGHSLGGAAAFEACAQDPDCAGSVDMDGTLWTDVRHAGLVAPGLVLRHATDAECDTFCERASADFDHIESLGSQQLRIAGSQHTNFTDLGLLWGPANKLVALGPIDADRMLDITRDLVRSFLDVHVLHAAEANFTAVVSRYPEVE
jgi:pimeloyl-ACP methyl ester carboxylesterase